MTLFDVQVKSVQTSYNEDRRNGLLLACNKVQVDGDSLKVCEFPSTDENLLCFTVFLSPEEKKFDMSKALNGYAVEAPCGVLSKSSVGYGAELFLAAGKYEDLKKLLFVANELKVKLQFGIQGSEESFEDFVDGATGTLLIPSFNIDCERGF